MTGDSVAIVGAAGGVGTTRLTVELGATLARAGRDVAILDVAFATQGLARHVPDRITPDVTTVLTEDGSFADALIEHPYAGEVPGRLAVAPSHAPFGRVARAKSVDAAQRFEEGMAGMADAVDYVLVDTPPVATNPSVAAVTSSDRVAAVSVPSPRGVDALQQLRGRLADVGTEPTLIVANRVPEGESLPDADVAIPAGSIPPAGDAPVAFDSGNALAPAYAATAEALLDRPVGLEFERGLLEKARERLE